ncbi:hypothetical protein [Stutzerimonas stutzeri]|uniref:hypothetical protein n=1 Tax=Stutzerimonas stutzeri TaxID=316 RepID=UPI000A90F3EE|nr:hypothetical protein [Stutzerimonas stutzeri]
MRGFRLVLIGTLEGLRQGLGWTVMITVCLASVAYGAIGRRGNALACRDFLHP